MSDEITFDDVLYHLANNTTPEYRIEAARLLGENVTRLSDIEYQEAHKALNNALVDPDPQVIMAVMQALSRFNRKAREQARKARQTGDMSAAVAMPLCRVCGKPESIADGSVCPHENCPYKS